MRIQRNSAGWIQAYKAKNAYWDHSGNLKQPHALLASKLHSSGFFNSRLVIADEQLLREAAGDLVELYREKIDNDLSTIDCVVGPQTGATKLAEFIRDVISKKTNSFCHFASPEKSEENDKKIMRFMDPRNSVGILDKVLLCEDVLTTGGSVDLCLEAVHRKGGRDINVVLVMVNRSGLRELSGGRQILSLVEKHMPTWTAEECPLCKQGSIAIPPKDNWALLNAEY